MKGKEYWISKWDSGKKLIETFSDWSLVLKWRDRAYIADVPYVGDLDLAYPEKFSTPKNANIPVSDYWLSKQIAELYKLSNCKDLGIAANIYPFAKIFKHKVAPYKISEVSLFFARYAQGEYNSTGYTAFDLNHISYAFNLFLHQRLYEISAAEERAKEKERLHTIKINGYTDYIHSLEKKAAEGDNQAIITLKFHKDIR